MIAQQETRISKIFFEGIVSTPSSRPLRFRELLHKFMSWNDLRWLLEYPTV